MTWVITFKSLISKKINIVVDMLAIMIARAKDDGQVEGLIPHLVEGGLLYFSMLMIPSYL
jgi:hypothetical protein